jgi:hypothetical protein
MGRTHHRQDKDGHHLTDRERVALVVLSSVQTALAVSAWADLAQRDASEVDGSKAKWAAIIAITYLGPVAYFMRGRTKLVVAGPGE